jgi:hypothetical protein
VKGRAPALLCLVAGGGDAVTGLLLVAAPALVLRLLGIEPPARAAGDLIFLRFAGVFVGCVGLAYLYPWLLGRARREHRLAAAVEITAGFRLAVALFLTAAVAAGTLEAPWLTVGVYDALLAALQLGLLFRGRGGGFRDAA